MTVKAGASREQRGGVLTTIGVRQVLKENVGIARAPSVIPGTCNPRLTHRALSAEPELGLRLPGTVVTYQVEGGSVVAAMDPEAALAPSGDPRRAPAAGDANARLAGVRRAAAGSVA